MVKAVNSGQPLLLSHPQSPAALAISRLAGAIFNQVEIK
jgi:MinD-like ATPase involved in chromosome partitioning or flagellar assembly